MACLDSIFTQASCEHEREVALQRLAEQAKAAEDETVERLHELLITTDFLMSENGAIKSKLEGAPDFLMSEKGAFKSKLEEAPDCIKVVKVCKYLEPEPEVEAVDVCKYLEPSQYELQQVQQAYNSLKGAHRELEQKHEASLAGLEEYKQKLVSQGRAWQVSFQSAREEKVLLQKREEKNAKELETTRRAYDALRDDYLSLLQEKDVLKTEIASLVEKLETCVPTEDLTSLAQQHEALKQEHRALKEATSKAWKESISEANDERAKPAKLRTSSVPTALTQSHERHQAELTQITPFMQGRALVDLASLNSQLGKQAPAPPRMSGGQAPAPPRMSGGQAPAPPRMSGGLPLTPRLPAQVDNASRSPRPFWNPRSPAVRLRTAPGVRMQNGPSSAFPSSPRQAHSPERRQFAVPLASVWHKDR